MSRKIKRVLGAHPFPIMLSIECAVAFGCAALGWVEGYLILVATLAAGQYIYTNFLHL